ncbi:hypothetical protein BGW39_000705 [Mortierella sp. 14UC]|nr:hypothetical protein BGW39_000705 [Mortierella sp. 14UC]
MTASILKLASALAIFACAIQAAPLAPRCEGTACHQYGHSGSVQAGSVTNVVPETNVVPVTRLQPVVKVHTAIVESDCTQQQSGLFGVGGSPYLGRQSMDFARGGNMMLSPMEQGPAFGMMSRERMGRIGDLSATRFMDRMNRFDRTMNPTSINSAIMMKRTMGQPMLRPDCIPSATDNCVLNIPSSTTDMGSTVTAVPSNVILPSTVYQGKVKSGAAVVYAAEATDTALPGQRVNLGSDTFIQPITKVVPSTTYQPSVDQKATMVDAAPAMDQSLGRSSVSLGSSVYIRPTTTVEPLTVFQPKIQSLPFIINSETLCDSQQFQQQQGHQQQFERRPSMTSSCM